MEYCSGQKKDPAEKPGFEVEMTGLEPVTSCMPCKRSSQMSYTPINDDLS